MAHKRTSTKSSSIEENDDDMALRISPVSLNVCDENRGHSLVAKTSSNANTKKRRPASHATAAAPVEEHSPSRSLVLS